MELQTLGNSEGKGCGLFVGALTFVTSTAVALPIEVAAVQVVIAFISGAFYWFTSISVTWLKEIYRERRKRAKDALQKSTERSPGES